MSARSISRRDFLRLTSAASLTASASFLLSSCGGSSPAGGNVPTTRLLLDSWGFGQGPFKDMQDRWNNEHPEAPVKIESSPGGWQTKAIGQIRGGKLEWSGAGVNTPFLDLAAWVELGLIQPIEQYIAASKIDGASRFLSDMLPPVRDDLAYAGKLYAVPYGVETITYQWRKDQFGDLGFTEGPKSWGDLVERSGKLRDALKARGDTKTYPLAFDLHLARSAGALIHTASKTPYTDAGLINWDSAEMRECLKFMRQCSREGLTPPNCGVGADVVDMWLRGRVAGLYSTSSRGLFAQKSLGFDKVVTSPIPTVDSQPQSGAVFWGDCMTLLVNAPRMQEAVDFLIWAFGPQNADWQKGVAKAGLAPVFDSAYRDVLAKDPEMEPYRWMTGVRDSIAQSVPAPKNYIYQIELAAWNKWYPDYLNDKSTTTEDQLIANVLKTTEEMRQTVATSVPKK